MTRRKESRGERVVREYLDAPGLRKIYGLGPDDSIRDTFSTEDLRSVVDVETVISSLLRLGYGYREIRDEMLGRAANFRRDAA